MNPLRHEHLAFALLLAREAERVILSHYRDVTLQWKVDGTEVTEADRAAEKAMRTMIRTRYPDHDILGEEAGGSLISSRRHRWILDPIDGTAWFSLGAPIFGTLIALVEDNEPVVGVIHMSAVHETTYAAKGLGCWFSTRGRRPRQVKVTHPVSLGEATVLASGAHASDILPLQGRPLVHLSRVAKGARKFKFYGDCAQHALVCRGNAHAAIDTVMNPWDIAAVVPCVEEAGGLVSTLSGDRKGIVFGGSLVTACSPSLLREILEALETSEDSHHRRLENSQNSAELLTYRQAL
jgi:histidinol-phosphatase